ncbi:MFS-type transporter SLC18B1-like [Corticium candelabrum]|uniref:MFS-type transporter SLC18B1-like n=1 Tax=Corticium candelabrum TaxID=121492 RepID=UPI002E277094|nr:MFS-type transporter SLC18B1-like [Corticium candelabrum]
MASLLQHRLIILLFVMVLRVLCLSSYSLISTYYPQHIKNSPYNQERPSEFTGYVVASFSPTYLLGSIFIGHVSLRYYGAKFCLVTGLFLAGGAWVLFGVLQYMTEWRHFLAFSVVLRLTVGFGVASVDVSSFSLVLSSYPDKIGLVSSLMEMTWSVSNILGPFMGGILYDWMGFIMPASSLGICLLLFAFIAVFVPSGNSMKLSYKSAKTHISTKQFIGHVCSLWTMLTFVSGYIIAICLSFPQATLSSFLHKKFHFSPRQVGFVFLASGVANAVPAPVVGKMCDMMHPRWFVPSGIITAGAGGFFLMSFGNSIVLQVLAQVFIGIGSALTLGSCYTDLLKEFCRKLQVDKLDETTIGKVYSAFRILATLGEITGSASGGVFVESLGFGKATLMWGSIGTSFGVVYLLLFAISRICGNENMVVGVYVALRSLG